MTFPRIKPDPRIEGTETTVFSLPQSGRFLRLIEVFKKHFQCSQLLDRLPNITDATVAWWGVLVWLIVFPEVGGSVRA